MKAEQNMLHFAHMKQNVATGICLVSLKLFLLLFFQEYERIFFLLKHVQGSLQTRLIFLQNVIKEASR